MLEALSFFCVLGTCVETCNVSAYDGSEVGASVTHVFLVQQAAATGDVNPRTNIGQRFARELAKDAQLKLQYNADRCFVAKRNFRAKWAADKYQNMEESREYKNRWQNVDQTKGAHMAL